MTLSRSMYEQKQTLPASGVDYTLHHLRTVSKTHTSTHEMLGLLGSMKITVMPFVSDVIDSSKSESKESTRTGKRSNLVLHGSMLSGEGTTLYVHAHQPKKKN